VYLKLSFKLLTIRFLSFFSELYENSIFCVVCLISLFVNNRASSAEIGFQNKLLFFLPVRGKRMDKLFNSHTFWVLSFDVLTIFSNSTKILLLSLNEYCKNINKSNTSSKRKFQS